MRDLLSENNQKTLARRIHKTCQGKHNKIEDKERKRYRMSCRNTVHDFSKKKRRDQRDSDGSKYRDQDPDGQPFLFFTVSIRIFRTFPLCFMTVLSFQCGK